jgi:glycosyltransferase involved in cell wall biosynthesis
MTLEEEVVRLRAEHAALRQRIVAMQLQGVLWLDEFVRDRFEIRRYLSAAAVYTSPSRYDGFPGAPIEAMSCGLPVVAAATNGVPDSLEGGEASGGQWPPVLLTSFEEGDTVAPSSNLQPELILGSQDESLFRRAQHRDILYR